MRSHLHNSFLLVILLLSAVVFPSLVTAADDVPKQASNNDKYTNLIQVLPCPDDVHKYGAFNDYGYWAGGPWCGQVGKAGYWVYVGDSWYVWESVTAPSSSVNGKYSDLIQVLECPDDVDKYGAFNDYGYWAGGPWCGQVGKAGYWVYVAPNWYVWKSK